jgi:thioredoxin-related protein
VGFAVIAIDVRDDRPNTRAFYEENGFEIPNVFDTRNVSVSSYRVAGTPTTFLVDSDGRIVWRRYGYLPGEEVRLRQKVEDLLGR